MNASSLRRLILWHVLAVALAGGAGVAQTLLTPYLQNRVSFISFVLAMVIAAWVGGPGPALTCLASSLLIFNYFVLHPQGGMYVTNFPDGLSLVVVTIVGLAICLLAGSLHSAKRRAERGRLQLVDVNTRLLEANKRLRQLGDAVPQVVWAANPDGSIDLLNARWFEYTGQKPGDDPLDVIHPEDRPHTGAAWIEAARTGKKYEHEVRLRRHDGVYRWHLSRMMPVRNAAGQIDKWFGTSADIEDLKVAEQKREELLHIEQAARIEAEQAARIKDEFLATVSHELRTPLNAILGWSQLLGSGKNVSTDDLAEGLKTIDRNARAQAALVNDLLDMSRIVTGKTRLEMRPTDLRQVVTDAVQSARPIAAAKSIDLRTDGLDTPVTVLGDAQRLAQVVWNLLSNSIKFAGENGRIEVSIRPTDATGDQPIGRLQLVVRDNGAGIEPSFLPHVFDRFRQADGSTTRKTGGLGLGLAIARNLVELHGGSIEARSDGPGRGTEMIVSLPIVQESPVPALRTDSTQLFRSQDGPAAVQPPAASEQPTPTDANSADVAQTVSTVTTGSSTATYASDPAFLEGASLAPGPALLNGLRVLVVDDEIDARNVLRKSLNDRGAEVVTAGSAAEAYRIAREQKPLVVVSDIGMPGEDGFSLLSRLRSSDDGALRRTPVVALTAFARETDRQRAMAAGFDAFLVKPTDLDVLAKTVAALTTAKDKV